jgi:hypothetical protein
MSLNNPYDGSNCVAEYLVSAIPWVTSSVISSGITQFNFPSITQFITVSNVSGSNLRLGFTQNGIIGNNYYTVTTSSLFSANLRITSLFLSSSGNNSVNISAGLTTVQSKFFTLPSF